MIERDLQAASDLNDLIKYTQSSITIVNADASNLRIFFHGEPFEKNGKTYEHISAAGALGVDPEELRTVVHSAIVSHLEDKIKHYRATLAKLGVKLDEPAPPVAVKPNRGHSKHKKLPAPKKPLQLKGPALVKND